MERKYLVCLLIAACSITYAQVYQFYALSTDKNINKPLYLCELDSLNGSMSVIENFGGVYKGNYLALAPDSKHLLATSFNSGGDQGGLVQYDVSDDGSLTLSHSQFKTGGIPCHVSFTQDMEYVLSAYYQDDKISLCSFQDSNISADIDEIVQPDESKGHFIQTDPSGKYVHAVFLGLDRIFNYTIEGEKFVQNTSQAYFALPSGYGPRHFVFHPEGNWLYILNETHCSVTACSYNSDNGSITEIQNISMLPELYNDKNIAAAIRIHPSGKFLYASNRGHNSIAVYEIADDGSLTFVEHETSEINYPRDFNITADGQYILVGNQKGNSIFSFRIDNSTGELEYTGEELSISNPLSIVFYPYEGGDTTSVDTISTDTMEGSANIYWNGSSVGTPIISYPNPSIDNLYLHSPDESLLEKVEVIDLAGRIVQTFFLHGRSSIDVTGIPRGTYLLNIESNIREYVSKVVFQ